MPAVAGFPQADGGEEAVLVDVSFFVPRGETVAILGRSGVGKSVTLKHLVGFLQPDRGRVWVDGRDVTDLEEKQWAEIRRRLALPRGGATGRNRMATTKSAKKAVRQIARRTEVNKARRSRMRTFVRKVEEAIVAGDQKAARAALQLAEPKVMRAAQKNVIHRNTASRKISRLSEQVRAMGA